MLFEKIFFIPPSFSPTKQQSDHVLAINLRFLIMNNPLDHRKLVR